MSRLAFGADLLLHLELDRQAVAVPAALPRHGVAGHRLEPRVDVLERAGLDVVDARAAVRRRRPLVEDPAGRALRWASERAEHVGLPPERQDRAPRAPGSSPSDRPVRTPSVPASTHDNAPSRMPGRGAGPAVPPRLPRTSRSATTHGRVGGPPRSRAEPGCAYCGAGAPVRAAARGGSPRRPRRRAPTGPRLASARRPPRRCSRRRLCRACYTLRCYPPSTMAPTKSTKPAAKLPAKAQRPGRRSR